MKAVRIHEFGGPEVLQIENLDRPEPQSGEVLIEMLAAGVNPVDYEIRKDLYPAVKAERLPVVLGRDAAGFVRQASRGVKTFAEGDAVFAMLPQDRGGYAQWTTVPASLCAPKPASLDMLQAASVPLAALTAWQGLDRSWPALKRGGTLISTVHEPTAEKAEAAGVAASRYTRQPGGEQLREIGRLINKGAVEVFIDRVFPLEAAAEAEIHLENDHVRGKVMLSMEP
jgi:NADPH:quinone reductase-like Zn-dependent oxidoreductase